MVKKFSRQRATPKMKLKAINLKPLITGAVQDINPDKLLRELKADLLRRIRRKLLQEAFSKRAKQALAKALSIEIMASSLRITAKHPAWGPLVLGQKSGPMKWLRKAKAPIPIVTETGEVIFRRATARSLKNGKWIHPGHKPTGFYNAARLEARVFMREKLATQIANQMRKGI